VFSEALGITALSLSRAAWALRALCVRHRLYRGEEIDALIVALLRLQAGRGHRKLWFGASERKHLQDSFSQSR